MTWVYTSESELENFVWNVFNAVFKVSEMTDEDNQSSLVKFMEKLRKTEVTVTDQDGQSLELTVEGGKLWTDMPTFGWVARDLWNLDPRATLEVDEYKRVFRHTLFLAQLTARSKNIHDVMDPFNFSMFGLWALRAAFEEDPMRHTGSSRHITDIKLAAVWIRCAGRVLLKLSEHNVELPGNVAAGGSMHANRGFKGFSMKRWDIWKHGFISAKRVNLLPSDKDLLELVLIDLERLKPSVSNGYKSSDRPQQGYDKV
ncbi:hypothetical protein QBC34DRAFT_297677 [Podospora aff. communis PSN243]|uniref:Fungal-type protein kinase domain-containing protein n=1 Tax=Podospora aff. communis PSN243 TaxID=3040156 RepID=A0AAV9GS07_9PEZI|nr:hypothetical protein QBC34DRAFT_297677 [Podospora aff. communis PSN243]